MKILGIETSCDETAASIVEDGTTILSSVISSQIELHHQYGGVVPELASRKHVENIVPVVEEAFKTAGLSKNDVDAVAVTQGPGLVGALLVGFSFAKAFAYSAGIPFVGVNHLMGHINSVFPVLEKDQRQPLKRPEFPFTALLASGGHTSIYYVTSHTDAELLGQTRDDAAGEAYDKVSKMLGLGYPGGKIIDDLAGKGNPQLIKFTRSFLNKKEFDFSFSGIKSAVARYIETHDDYMSNIPDIVAGFQEAVVDVLAYKLINSAVTRKCGDIAVVGGVAANSRLRERVTFLAKKRGIRVFIPSLDLCGDNAAMIASVGYHYLQKGFVSGHDDDVFSRAKVTGGKKHK
jgi:N6-L-threonylcarbamoyladenine synthase